MSASTLSSPSLNNLTSAESRALDLLGQGINPEHTAMAVGLSPSRISQLLSDSEFAAAVSERRFTNLSKHNERDASYDELEDKLLERMKDCLPLMVRPGEILKAIQVINAAKRRGSSAPSAITDQTTIINLVLPNQIINKFSLNGLNQVVQVTADDKTQPMLTIQSGTLLNQIKEKASVQSIPSKKILSADDF